METQVETQIEQLDAPLETSKGAGASMIELLLARLRKDKGPQEKLPPYIEVMGEAFTEVAFLRHLTAGLAGISVLLLMVLARVANRPPVVIRIDELRGAVAVKDLATQTTAGAAEVRNFAEHFTRDLMGWDLYTLDDDINRALAMMTPEAGNKMKHQLDGQNLTSKVKSDSLRTKVTVREITVDRDAEHAIVLKVRGSRLSQSYEKKDYRHETIFEDTLVIRKVARSDSAPWGLLVEDWTEHVFQETQTP